MKTAVTMKTKGVTQDKDGNYGIWRTIKRVGKVFIRVGETGEGAVARYTKELLAKPPKQIKKDIQFYYDSRLSSSEYALWRKKISEIWCGGYFEKTKNGDYYIPIGNKIVITDSSNETMKKVLVFKDEEKMINFLKRRKGK